jgi:hypothetical protein
LQPHEASHEIAYGRIVSEQRLGTDSVQLVCEKELLMSSSTNESEANISLLEETLQKPNSQIFG